MAQTSSSLYIPAPREKDVKDESEGEADEGQDGPDQPEDDDADDDAFNSNSASVDSNGLQDFQYKFDSALRQPSRGLLVKDLMILFGGSSIYGRRAAFHKGLIVTVSWLIL